MGLIPQDIVTRVIECSDIVSVIGEYFPLKKSGRNFKACCPFHQEKTASFMVNPDKQIFHCFGCGVGGNVVSFIMQQERMDFPEAIRFLAQKAGIEIREESSERGRADKNLRQSIFDANLFAVEFFHKNLISDKTKKAQEARDYLKRRGVSLETVKELRLGLALDQWDGVLNFLKSQNVPFSVMEKAGLIISRDSKEGYYDRFRGRIMFPIFDSRGNPRAFGGRALEDGQGAKYMNSPETFVYTKGHHLYGFDLAKQAILENDKVIITEGYMDFLMPYQQGVRNIVASLGTALTVDQVRLLRRYTKNVVFLFDMDDAGEAAMMRSLDLLVEEDMNVCVARLEEGEDPDSYIRKYGVDAFLERIDQAKELFDYKFEALLKRFDPKKMHEKAQICTEMLTTISRFENAVLQSGYVSRLSRRIHASESALMQEMQKLRGKKSSDNFDSRKIKTAEKTHGVESNLLKLMLEEESFILRMQKDVSLEDFRDSRVRNVIQRVFDLYAKGEKITFGHLLSQFDDPDAKELISFLMKEEEIVVQDKEKMFQDCLNRLKSKNVKEQRSVLLDKIREAEVSGKFDELETLKKEFNQLVKQ